MPAVYHTGDLCQRGWSLSRGLVFVKGVSVQGSLFGGLSGESLSRGSLSRSLYLGSLSGGLCPGVSVWGSLSRGVCLRDLCQRDPLDRYTQKDMGPETEASLEGTWDQRQRPS